jgi:hypothetical protein
MRRSSRTMDATPMAHTLARLASLLTWIALACSCAAVETQSDPQVGEHRAVQARRARRPHQRPEFDGRVTFAGGDYDHDPEGAVHDETDAGFFGLLAEVSGASSGIGGGIELEVMGTDDDLFENGPVEQQISTFGIAPFFLCRMRAGDRFRIPVRIGPWLHFLDAEDEGSSDSLTWATLGLRFAVEPEMVLVQDRDFQLSLFSEVSLAGGGSVVHEELGSTDEDYETTGGVFGLEIGPRFRMSHFFASVSFLHRGISMDESDSENGVRIPGFDSEFNALAFSFGGGF